MSENWTSKHRPTEWNSIQGNTTAVEAIREWIEDWEPGDQPQLLVGEPGTGKTSTAYVAATQTGLDFNEIDASTARKSDDVRRFAGEMRAGEQLVLLDEVDSWHHAVNLDPLNRELRDPQNPVILTANDEYDIPQAVKGPSEVHEFKLSSSSRRAKLKEIAKAEGVPLDEKDLERLVKRPDLRSAINDLQIHAQMGVPVDEDQRDWDGSEFEAMDQIIQYEDASDIDVRPPWLVMWLDQNVRKQYTGLELAAAYDCLSRADLHLGASGAGDYRGWRYAGVLAEEVANLRLTDPYTGWVRWEFPSWVQSSEPSVDEETDEAALYRELKNYGRPGYSMAGSYVEFRETILPILRRESLSKRLDIVQDQSLTPEAASALGVTQDEYEDAMVQAEARGGTPLEEDHGDALSGEW